MSYSPATATAYPPGIQSFISFRQCIPESFWSECDGYNVGGVNRVYLLVRNDLGRVYLNLAGEVTGFENAQFNEWLYLPLENGAAAVSTVAENAPTGRRFSTSLTGARARIDPAKWATVQVLLYRRAWLLIQDNNDQYWLIGRNQPARLAQATWVSGQADGDFNGLQAEFTQLDFCPPLRLTEQAIDALVFDLNENCGGVYQSALNLATLSKCLVATYNSTVL